MLTYVTEKSRIGSGPAMFVARTVGVHTCTMKDLFEDAQKAEPNLTHDGFYLPIERLDRLICSRLIAGEAVRTNLFTVKPVVKGKVPESLVTSQGQFKVGLSLSPAKTLTDAALEVEMRRDESRACVSRIKSVYDEESGASDSRLTPGGKLTITGVKIRVHGSHPDVGLRFVNPNTGVVIKLTEKNLSVNETNRIIVIAPKETVGGRWQLQIITQFIGSSRKDKQRKEPQTLTFAPILTT